MSSEDTKISVEVIVDAVLSNIQREMEDVHGSSSEFELISSSPELHKLVFLMRVCTYEGGAVDTKLFTRNNIRKLCLHCKGHYDPYDIEMMSSHEVCLTIKKEVTLRLVAGNLMSVEDCTGVPLVITVVILGKNKVRAILEARERHRQEMRERSQKREDEVRKQLERSVDDEDRSKPNIEEYYGKQRDLEKLVESLNDKIQELETQPIGGKGFTTCSAQNLSGSFRNLTTSFQVKADLDLGKFSGMEPVPSNVLTFDQWRIDVHSYQTNVPDYILLPVI